MKSENTQSKTMKLEDMKLTDLPFDIIIQIFDLLQTRSINLGLTCKTLYQYYVEKRDHNKLIASRFKRVTDKFNECSYRNSIGIVFDRMYNLHPYHESTIQMMFAKVYYPLDLFPRDLDINNFDVYWHFTLDKWKTVEREKCNVVDWNKRGNLIESTWLADFTYRWEDFDQIWFAIELIDKKNHTSLWDNNSGWNYNTEREHHWIPDYPVIERFPIMGFHYGNYIDSDYCSLNQWLYDY